MFNNISFTKRIVLLVLSLAIAISLLGACSNSDSADNNSSSKNTSSANEKKPNNNTTSDNTNNLIDPDAPLDGEENIPDTDTNIPGDEEFEDEDYSKPVYTYTVPNASKPVIDSYRGMSATVWHAYGFMKDDKTGRVYTDEMMEIELDRLQRMGVHTCRTIMKSQWIWSATANNWDFDSKRANYFYDYCKELQRRGMNIILNLGWDVEFAIEIVKEGKDAQEEVAYLNGRGDDVNGESVGYDFSGLNEYWTRVTKSGLRYADLYAKLLTELRSRGINNIDYLLYFTEPSNRKADGSYHPEGAGASAEQYTKLCRIISDALDKSGTVGNIKSVGACQGGANDGLVRYVIAHDPELFDILGSHHYPTATYITDNVYYEVADILWEKYIDAMKGANLFGRKEFWCDEYAANDSTTVKGEPDTSPWNGLQAVVGLIASQRRGISNTISWQAADQLWTDSIYNEGEFREGVHMCGAMPSLFNSDIPRGEYYMWGLFSRYNGYQNGKVYYVDYTEDDIHVFSGLHIGVVQLEDGNWTVTVVNADTEPSTFIIDFEKAIGRTLYRHTENVETCSPDSKALIADVDKVYMGVQDKFTDTIPGGTLAVYTTVKG